MEQDNPINFAWEHATCEEREEHIRYLVERYGQNLKLFAENCEEDRG